MYNSLSGVCCKPYTNWVSKTAFSRIRAVGLSGGRIGRQGITILVVYVKVGTIYWSGPTIAHPRDRVVYYAPIGQYCHLTTSVTLVTLPRYFIVNRSLVLVIILSNSRAVETKRVTTCVPIRPCSLPATFSSTAKRQKVAGCVDWSVSS